MMNEVDYYLAHVRKCSDCKTGDCPIARQIHDRVLREQKNGRR